MRYENLNVSKLRVDEVISSSAADPRKLTYNGDKALAIYITCASTNASTSYEPVLFNSVMTGTGQVGGRVKCNMSISNVVLGGWANALKAQVECNTSGRASGLLSAFCAEMVLPASDVSGLGGHYAPLEVEFTAPASCTPSTNTSFIYMNIGGNSTAITALNTNGYLFELGTGIADTASGFFDAESKSGIAKTHTLRVLISGTPYYIPLHTAQACGGT